MRRLVVAMVVVGLMSVNSGTIAQSPSPEPPPWFGGRVEMLEHGFAVTVPAGWVAFDLTRDEVEQARTAAVANDPE